MRKIVLILAVLLASTAHAGKVSFIIAEGLDNATVRATMERNTLVMIDAMNNAAEQGKKVKISKDVINESALETIRKMWETSAMSFPAMKIAGRCIIDGDGYQVRGIPVDMLDADVGNKRKEIAVDYDRTGKITAVTIAIEMHRYEKLLADHNDAVDYAHKQVVLNFVESFRTAYNERNISYLEQVYSDDALIITGRVLKTGGRSLESAARNKTKIEYSKQSKKDYIAKMKRVFKTNKYIDVIFKEIDVVQHPKFSEVYGVTLKQFWNTTNYSDEGYLFLLIDFHDKDKPLIQVRTWQPYKDSNGNVILEPDDVFNVGSFRIYR